jgi:hypothetical protein
MRAGDVDPNEVFYESGRAAPIGAPGPVRDGSLARCRRCRGDCVVRTGERVEGSVLDDGLPIFVKCPDCGGKGIDPGVQRLLRECAAAVAARK